MQRHLLHCLITLGLLIVFATLFRYHNPITSGALAGTFNFFSASTQAGVVVVFLLLVVLLGGRFITNVVLVLAIVWFAPAINYEPVNDALYRAAELVENNNRRAAAEMYMTLRHWASYAIYVVAVLSVAVIYRRIRRDLKHGSA